MDRTPFMRRKSVNNRPLVGFKAARGLFLARAVPLVHGVAAGEVEDGPARRGIEHHCVSACR